MVSYYLKESRSRQKCEVHWTEDKVSVVSVKTTAAEKFNIPMKDQRNITTNLLFVLSVCLSNLEAYY
jgi:hypothetical protein